MKLYIYDIDTKDVLWIIERDTNEECEAVAQPYANEYGSTYSPAFGHADGLIENQDAEIL